MRDGSAPRRDALRRSLVAALICVLVVALGPAPRGAEGAAAGGFALRDGDRVVFFGDSITEQRLYTSYVEQFVVSRYPDRRIAFVNSGWGGDQVSRNECEPCAGVGALARIERDVVALRPTVVTLLFGMNDGQYRDFDPATLERFERGLAEIVRTIKAKTRARVYVMTPSAYDGTRKTPWSQTDRYNDVLARYAERAKAVAAAGGAEVVDLHRVTTEALRAAKAADPEFTTAPDGVHPDENGQIVMATEILRAWGADPSGAEVSVAARSGPAGIAPLTVRAPLPWPSFAPSEKLLGARAAALALGSVRVRVTGLPAGDYRVAVDGADAGMLSSEALAAGVPVGAVSAAARERAAALAAVVRDREQLYALRWRQVQVPFSAAYPDTARAVEGLDLLLEAMAGRERELGAPHEYRITLERLAGG